MKYVSPEYELQLSNLAELLISKRRFAPVVEENVQLILDIPENIVIGEE